MVRRDLYIQVSARIGASFDEERVETSASEATGEWSTPWATTNYNVVVYALLVWIGYVLSFLFGVLVAVCIVLDLMDILMLMLLCWDC